MKIDENYVLDLEHRVAVYSHVLLEVETARKFSPDPVLDQLSHRAHNVLCHLEDGCGH